MKRKKPKKLNDIKTPEEMVEKLDQLAKAVAKYQGYDVDTSYGVIRMFQYLKKLIRYQVPMPPIDVSEDGHKFTCPRCETKFDSEDTVDEFNLCYICGQRWKEEVSEEE